MFPKHIYEFGLNNYYKRRYQTYCPMRLESWFLLTRHFKDNRQAPFLKIAPALFSFHLIFFLFFSFLFFSFLSTAYESLLELQDRILARGSAIKKSSSHSLGTFLHPRPPRHSRLSDVRNKERLKHKGFMRDIQANLAVNAMDQESL